MSKEQKVGRPKTRKRLVKLNLSMEESDKKALMKAAFASGMSASGFVESLFRKAVR